MDFDLDRHTIFLAVTGSHAYGTSRPESDVDIRGCAVAPSDLRLSCFRRFEQFQSMGRRPKLGPVWRGALETLRRHPTAGAMASRPESEEELDIVVFEVAKLVQLCAEANPNMLELLFLHPDDVIYSSPRWQLLRDNRALFLSRKAKFTYTGYAQSQLKRIKGHRAWLLSPPSREPTRADFDLPEQTVLSADDRNRISEAVTKIIRGWGVEDMEIPSAERDVLREHMRDFWATTVRCQSGMLDEKVYELGAASLGLTRDVLYALRQERKYRAARKQWEQYKRWERERNPKRADLEARHGFDTKHGMHLIRLMRTGLEILTDGELRVRRPDAAELLEIRNGAYSYDALIAEAESLERKMDQAVRETTLPRSADKQAIDEVFLELLRARD